MLGCFGVSVLECFWGAAWLFVGLVVWVIGCSGGCGGFGCSVVLGCLWAIGCLSVWVLGCLGPFGGVCVLGYLCDWVIGCAFGCLGASVLAAYLQRGVATLPPGTERTSHF